MGLDTKAKLDREKIIQYSERTKEPFWMKERRLHAFEQFEKLPLPKLEKTKIDNWELYPSLEYQEEERVNEVTQLPKEILSYLSDEGEILPTLFLQKNHQAVYSHLSDQLKELGVIFTDLQTAMISHSELIEKKFMTEAVSTGLNQLTALHGAAWDNGVFLYVPKNVEVKVPIQGLFWVDGKGSSMLPHILIIAEQGSSLIFVENVISTSEGKGVYNGVTEVFVGANAKVTFASVHHAPKDFIDITHRKAIVENDGHMEWIIGEMNNGNTVSENVTLLKGRGSSVNTQSVMIGTRNQRGNYTSKVIHIGTHTESSILSRGVMKEESTAILNGITEIKKGAQKANGEQTENILMLSDKSRGDANPILLIDEDDVKAGHAASVGQINASQLFYFMSRGIPKEEAERLIIRGFLAPVVSNIPIEGVKNRLEQVIERKLGR
ncbi:Fe-S cluster assembly protein SufD [Microaerobacter geothermalis]|uniref:Fe-S cluster assembly protein SufD n=1 Tax=Microaerobacter geothermalis TaxID=674972 RepID=UPI001F43C26F|nr:Fe-S cluster assembly protein SufD [Microaerobacter geothermalis]MCF6092383.1 Fe-S cluster assembly protein SufD [Microaerobacter geothermalis]